MEGSTEATRTQGTNQPEAGLGWSDILRAYRLERSQRWSTLLLERLGPWLTNARKTLLQAPPFADREDVEQQLAIEVLRLAARWQPHCEDTWIPRKLVEAACRRVRKSLCRERARKQVELDERLPGPSAVEPIRLDTPIGRASAADLQVIFRYHVLGVPLGQLAREAGITPRQMRRRLQRAKERARA